MNSPTFREIEQINTYLDGQLSQGEVARLENRLKNEPELAAAYQQLSQARSLLRQLPARRAPRNFTLTPKMAGVKAPTPRAFPVFRLASVAASLLLVLTFAANGIGHLAASAPAAPVFGIGGGPSAAAESRPQSGGGNDQANTEAPAAAPVAPAATEAPLQMAPLATDAAASTAAPETMRTAAEPTVEATADTFQKTAPELPPEQPAVTQPPQPPLIPAWLQAGLLIVALFAAGLAGLARWNAQRQFRRRNQ